MKDYATVARLTCSALATARNASQPLSTAGSARGTSLELMTIKRATQAER